jgi:hypothetical protein
MYYINIETYFNNIIRKYSVENSRQCLNLIRQASKNYALYTYVYTFYVQYMW